MRDGTGGPMRVQVEFAHDLDAAAWARRHLRGEVPDLAPYGLHRLRRFGVEPVFRRPLPGRAGRRVDRAVRAKGGGFDWLESARHLPLARPDAVLCWEESAGVPAVVRHRLVRRSVPVATGVIWLTEPDVAATPWGRRAARALADADAVWVLSRVQADLLRAAGFPAGRLHVVAQGIDADFFGPADPDRAEPGLVVGAGNDRHRDHPLLLEAVSRLRRRGRDVRVEIATRLPVATEAPWAERHGGLDARGVRDLYARASVVAVTTVPNHHASGLTVALEGMAVGRPVVVPSGSGLEDYVLHGVTGLVYSAGDPASLAGALERLVDGGDEARSYGRAARAHVEAAHTTDHQAAALAAVVGAVLGGAAVRPGRRPESRGHEGRTAPAARPAPVVRSAGGEGDRRCC